MLLGFYPAGSWKPTSREAVAHLWITFFTAWMPSWGKCFSLIKSINLFCTSLHLFTLIFTQCIAMKSLAPSLCNLPIGTRGPLSGPSKPSFPPSEEDQIPQLVHIWHVLQLPTILRTLLMPFYYEVSRATHTRWPNLLCRLPRGETLTALLHQSDISHA